MKRQRLPIPVEQPEMRTKRVYKSELDLFSNPLEQDVIWAAKDFEYGPDYALNDSLAIEFSPTTDPEYFVDLSASYLVVRLRVLREDGTLIDATDTNKVNRNRDRERLAQG